MILVTTAANDVDLREWLRKFLGKKVVFADLAHGDTILHGKWFNNTRARRLIERKKIGDLISCIQTGRYLFQWQRAHEAGWKEQYLFAELEEGTRYKESRKTGMVEVKYGKDWVPMRPEFEWHRIETFLNEVGEYLGVKVVRTRGSEHTAKLIASLYLMLQRFPEDHQQLHTIYTPPKPREDPILDIFERPSVSRTCLASLPHVGWALSKVAEEKFGSIRSWVNAAEEEWTEIPKVGKKIAKDIVEELAKDNRDGKKHPELSINDLSCQ